MRVVDKRNFSAFHILFCPICRCNEIKDEAGKLFLSYCELG